MDKSSWRVIDLSNIQRGQDDFKEERRPVRQRPKTIF